MDKNIKFWLVVLGVFLNLNSTYAQPDNALLEDAYKADSIGLYYKFLDQYASNTEFITQYDNDTVRETYKVFEALYKPVYFYIIKGSCLSPDYFKSYKFLIVQNSIGIYFTKRIYYSVAEIDSLGLVHTKNVLMDTKPKISEYDFLMKHFGSVPLAIIRRNAKSLIEMLNPITKVDTISDFKPHLQLVDKKVIYLTTKFDSAINFFLKNKYVFTGERLFNLSSDKESTARKKSLDRIVKVWYGKSGNYWQLIPYPLIYQLVFDSKMVYAKLKVKLSYGGADVVMQKVDGVWQVLSVKRTE